MMAMEHYIYHLKFDTPVHFGTAEQGGKLEQAELVYPSDRLFGALCCELSRMAPDGVQEWMGKAEKGGILLSDLLPYSIFGKESYYYLPKPVLLIDRDDSVRSKDLDEIRKQATIRKKQKKLTYIRASRMGEYLAAMKTGSAFEETADFGESVLVTQVWQRREEDPLPYYVSKFCFCDNAGMFLLAGLQEREDALRLYRLLQGLGLDGIGGKRSSGCGKFHVMEEPKMLSFYKDADLVALSSLLADSASPWQMCISSLIPKAEEISVVKKSQYCLMKRSGFLTPMEGEAERKKNSIYALGAGSCFPSRLSGCIVSLGQYFGHEAYRVGKGMYVGLTL